MKKNIKISLIGAMLLSGVIVNAQPLEQAIKNTDISGHIAMRYEDYSDKKGYNTRNAYKLAINTKSKVNDDVMVNTRMLATNINGGTTQTHFFNTSNEGDSNLNLTLSEVNFLYTGIDNASITIGKQGVFSPWTIPRFDFGTEQTGSGISGTYSLGNTMLHGAYFNQTNFDAVPYSRAPFNFDADKLKGSNFMYAGITSHIGSTSLAAYYSDTSDVFDSYYLSYRGTYDISKSLSVTPFAKYTSLTMDNRASDSNDQEMTQGGLIFKYGIYKTFFAYGESGDEGGLVFVDMTAKTGMDYHWRVTALGAADAKYTFIHQTAQVTDKLNLGLFYTLADLDESKGDFDEEEIYAQAVYKMSSNLKTYIRAGELKLDNPNNKSGSILRAQVTYSF